MIAIPAAAEKAIQFSFAERTNRVQRFFEPVGRMREIDENFRARNTADPLQSAARRNGVFQARGDRFRRDSRKKRKTRRRESVIYVMPARERNRGTAERIGKIHKTPAPRRRFVRDHGKRVRRVFQSVGKRFFTLHFKSVRDFPPRSVIRVHHKKTVRFRVQKKRFFRTGIAFHRLEKIEMILRTIGKNPRIKRNPRNLFVMNRMRRHFQKSIFYAVIPHIGKRFL